VNPMGSSSREFEVEIFGNASLEEFDQYATEMIDRLQQSGGIVDLDKSLRLGLPEGAWCPTARRPPRSASTPPPSPRSCSR